MERDGSDRLTPGRGAPNCLGWRAQEDSNLGPSGYEPDNLTPCTSQNQQVLKPPLGRCQ